MAYLDLVSELAGTIAGLSPLLAEKHVQRAWRDIRGERRWSFLRTDGFLACPVMITTGTVAVVQFDSTVTLNAAASAAFPADTATPSPTQLQIRFGGSSTLAAGQIYRIMAVDRTNVAALVLTLDRQVVETTNVVSGYQLYRCYVTPPADFKAWDAVIDMTYGFDLMKKGIRTSTQFDATDPQRTSQGDAYYIGFFQAAGPYGANNTPDPNVEAGSPIYELWPHPTSGRNFYVRIDRNGEDFSSPDDTQPALIEDGLILSRALYKYSYPWAQANVGSFPGLAKANWLSLIQTAKTDYRDALRDAKKNDDAAAAQSVWNRGHGLRGGGGIGFPIDAAFVQSHLLNF